MAVKAHQIVVVGCPRSELTGSIKERKGVGKSCFCNRFVNSDTFSLHHDSVLSEIEWQSNKIYNKDHFLYWGAVTKILPDGDTARFHIVEQTEFYNANYDNASFPAEEDYISRACSTHFISRGKAAYKVHNEEEYTIPTSPRYKGSVPSQATQLFPNNEFSEGKGVTGFICLFDTTLRGEDIKLQVDFLSKLLQELVKAKHTVILACTKCDKANDGLIQLGANFAATIIPKKPLPFVQTSSKEDVNINDCFFQIVNLNRKKSIVKTFPTCLLPTYSEVVVDRAMIAFNHVIKENVHQFSTEWSDIWPTLQRDQAIAQIVEALGIEKARDIFSQHLIEIKVNEVQAAHPKNRKLNQQQIKELKEAFNGHPDLGNDFVNDLNFLTSPLTSPMKSKSSSLSHSLTSPTQFNGSNTPNTLSIFPPKSLPTSSPTSENTNFEISVDYHKKDDILNEHDQTSASFNTLQEQHSCSTDHPYTSSPSSTISPYLTTHGTTKCTKSENHYYHVLIDEKASWVDSTNRTRTNSDGENPYYSIIHAVDHEPSLLDATYAEEENPYYSVVRTDDHKPSLLDVTCRTSTYTEGENSYSRLIRADEPKLLDVNSKENKAMVLQREQVTDLKRKEDIEKELMSEIERIERTLTLQLSDKDKEIDKLKQKLEEIRQKMTEDLHTYLYDKEDNLRNVIEAGDTFFVLQGCSQPQYFTWEKYGLILTAPADILPSSETCKVAITALAGGDFEFPKGSELVSAVYAIFISKTLLKPLTVNIQHCVSLETPEQCKSLQFVKATLNNRGLPYQFKVLEGGCFTPENQYGSISCTHFCLIGVLLGGNGEGQNGGMEQGENGEGQNGGMEQGGNGGGQNGGMEQGGNGEEQNGGMEQGGNGEEQNGGGEQEDNEDEEEGKEDGSCGGEEETQVIETQEESEEDKVYCKPFLKTHNALSSAAKAGFGRSNVTADMLYFCKVYREKEDISLWKVMFTVVKELDVLSEYIRKEHPNAFEILKKELKLSSQSYVEFDFKKHSEKTPRGWEINPLINPTRLYREYIDTFGSSGQSEPSSCTVVVHSKQLLDTEEFFYYSVPVLLDDTPYVDISFYLYNTPQIGKSEIDHKGSAVFKVDQMITSDNDEEVDKVKKVIQKVLKQCSSNLHLLLKECLQDIVTDMFSKDLVSQNTKNEPNAEKMMNEFKLGMNFICDCQELIKYCKLFLSILARQGGPFKRAADKLAQEWTTNIERELGVNWNFSTK